MSPWIWRLGATVVYVEELPDGTSLLRQGQEPSPSELEREAKLRERQTKVGRPWMTFEPQPGSARQRWHRAVVEHEVERRAQREGRGGQDE
jgi:hypothetical protein